MVVWFVMMLYSGDQAYANVKWDNVFLHCLGTVVMTALGSALLAGMLWCVYYVFQSIVGGWGRVLVVPWIGISVRLYPHVLNQDWPDTNPDPKGTAAFFATFEGAGIVLLGLLLGMGLYALLRGARSAFGEHPPFLAAPAPFEESQPIEVPSDLTPDTATPTAPQPAEPDNLVMWEPQMRQLMEGKRRVVMYPKGTEPPMTFPPNSGVTSDNYGNIYVFRPDLITRSKIKEAVENNTLLEILGW